MFKKSSKAEFLFIQYSCTSRRLDDVPRKLCKFKLRFGSECTNYDKQTNRSVISKIITRVPKARVMIISDITRLISLLIVFATDFEISNAYKN